MKQVQSCSRRKLQRQYMHLQIHKFCMSWAQPEIPPQLVLALGQKPVVLGAP